MKISNNKIPFGLKDGILVGVSEVQSGLACGCVCPSCHRKLQANKGMKVAHYFSHDPSKDTKVCETAFETSIHLMAKQILSEEEVVLFPELIVKVTQADANDELHEEAGVEYIIAYSTRHLYVAGQTRISTNLTPRFMNLIVRNTGHVG